jgi:hypothetical protein
MNHACRARSRPPVRPSPSDRWHTRIEDRATVFVPDFSGFYSGDATADQDFQPAPPRLS